MKSQMVYSCRTCDAQYTKWTGRCFECGQWGTVGEVAEAQLQHQKSTIPATNYTPVQTQALHDISEKQAPRMETKISELDRVLGGGLVPGSFILLAGEPGIGKSTLALQLAVAIPQTLYLSGEESIEQIKLRATRLHAQAPELRLANATTVEHIMATIQKEKPTLTIIDSIQTISSEEAEGEPGNITQVRACAAKLMEMAKALPTTIVIVGHVTKDGSVAGPKTLEHLVDVVISFEGDRHHHLRLLRCSKNRFGATDEVGVFEMTETGLHGVTNPSQLLLAERGDNVPGSIVTCLMEGTRPFLVEIQALVNKTVFGYPVRKASGFDINRLHVLVAVLERRAKLQLGQYDIHVNVVGGVKANEPAADLAVALAIASAYKEKAVGKDLVAFGEVGLGGEIRSVRFGERRLKECAQLGMKRVILAATEKIKKGDTNISLIAVKNIEELISRTG